MAATFCTQCGRFVAPGSAFCPSCGSAQWLPPPPTNAGTSFVPAPPPGPGNKSDTGLVVVVVVVAVVALFIVASFVWVLSVETGRQTPFSPNLPLGTAFAVGDAVEGTCPAGSTFDMNGCGAGDFQYTATVEASIVTFGDVAFELLTLTGSVVTGTGGLGFTVFNGSGVLLAQHALSGGPMSMSSASWTYASGTSSSTPLVLYDTVVIDVGTVYPVGLGYYFVASGVGPFTGTTGTPLP